MNPKPGTLTAIQVILFVQAGLAALGLLLAFIGMGAMTESELRSVAGVGTGTMLFIMLIGVATTGFNVYVAATMGQGGYRTRTLVRVVVGIGGVSVLVNIVTGGSFLIALVLLVVIVVLNEGAAASQWYEETEHPQRHQGR
ncbi:hypothetical protein [Nocardiopsis sp. NPDC006938]|uniref:hypothetical protein n=1 Tax=Nocardiopsis sp. NPDC006938 TaxID=3364337 RepID=UPI003689480D